jgi:hypothetical protein
MTMPKLWLRAFAYIGPIMMWWDLNDNGPSFDNTLMLRWGTYYKIEMQITQVLVIPLDHFCYQLYLGHRKVGRCKYYRYFLTHLGYDNQKVQKTTIPTLSSSNINVQV